MTNQDIKNQAIKIISGHRTGILSSVENNKPHSRYMTYYNDDLTLYTPTQMDTEKIEEIEKNPYVAVLLGYEEKGQSDTFIEITGKSAINNTETLKKQFWDDSFQEWFEGPEDPNYVYLQITPEVVRILNMHGEPPQELSLENE